MPEKAPEVCSPPYDVVSREEAKEYAGDNENCFFHVTRPDIDFPPDADPYSEEVYKRGAEALEQLWEKGVLLKEEQPTYYLYRQIKDGHAQTGVIGVSSTADYEAGKIKRHELTRPEKVEDRARGIMTLNAQTGLVFLTYRNNEVLQALLDRLTTEEPAFDFDSDGVRHTVWAISSDRATGEIEDAFARLPSLYIADGHHRTEAAVVSANRIADARGAGPEDPSRFFLTICYPHDQVRILAYNRLVHDLNGMSEAEFVAKLSEVAEITEPAPAEIPDRRGSLTMYLGGQWRLVRWRKNLERSEDPVRLLDVAILQNYVLGPMLGIDDPRTSKRIEFIGGSRGPQELQKRVNKGDGAVAFHLYPTSLEELMAVADAGKLMPPKSTWFDPKPMDGVATNVF